MNDERVSDQSPVPLLRAQDVHLAYGRSPALVGASIDVYAGEVVAVTGKSGSGKSSLLYCLAGIARPDRGPVFYAGRNIGLLNDDQLSELRRKEFGFVFQFGELVPELSIRENVALPLRLNHEPRRSINERVEPLLEALGIAEAAHKRPTQVSGGQAQRAAVARALVHRPRVVFADEPTGSLDSDNSEIVLAQFVSLARDAGVAVVLVTHEAKVAAIADRHVEVVDGTTRPGVLAR